MKTVFEKIRSTFGRRIKSSVCAMFEIVLVGLTVLCTSGCDKLMGMDESEVKESVLKIANNMLKENPVIPSSIKAVSVQDVTLVQESFSKRVGYANVVFKSSNTGKEVTLKYNVKLTGSVFDEKQLIEIQLSNSTDSLKLLGLVGGL